MGNRVRSLRILDLAIAVAIMAVGFAVLAPWAAACYAVGVLGLCYRLALERE